MKANKLPSNPQLASWIKKAMARGEISAKALDATKSRGSVIKRFLDHSEKPFPGKTQEERNLRIGHIVNVLLDRGIITQKDIETMDVSNDIQANSDHTTKPIPKQKKQGKAVKKTVKPVPTITDNQQKKDDPMPTPITVETVPTIEPTKPSEIDDLKIKLAQSQARVRELETENNQLRNHAVNDVPITSNQGMISSNQDILTSNQVSISSNQLQAVIDPIIARIEIAHRQEIARLKEQIAISQHSLVILGMTIGKTIQKQTRNGKKRESVCWYAYTKGNKKIYLGSQYDPIAFEDKIKQWLDKNSLPIPETSLQSPNEQTSIPFDPMDTTPHNDTGNIQQITPA